MNDEERMSPDSPEGRAEYAAYKRASPAERRAVLGIPCEHLNTEDFVCLDCGSPVPPYDLDDAQEGRW